MATQIDSLSEQRRGGPAKYPWGTWQHGAWCIRRGEDFDVAPHSMAGLIRKQAARLGRRATVHVFEDRIEFEFCEVGERAAA